MNRSFRSKSFFMAGVLLFSSWSVSAAHAGSDEKIIDAAKKEGTVSYYTTMTLSQSKKVVDKFQEKYPFIKPELFRGGGDEVLNRILNEARGGLNAWDVVSTRGDSVLTLRNAKLITPYRSPESKFIDRDMVDDEGYWTAYYVNPYVLGYNTKLVKKEDVPKTYEQLLDPKWKGKKISIDDSAYGFLAGLIRAWGKEKAVEYFKSSPRRSRCRREAIPTACNWRWRENILSSSPTRRRSREKHPKDIRWIGSLWNRCRFRSIR